MLVVRFRVQCQDAMAAEMIEAMKQVAEAARSLPGVIHFDIGQDVLDRNALIATEVFEDRSAMENEEKLPAVAKVVSLLQGGALAGPPEWTIYEVASSESPQM